MLSTLRSFAPQGANYFNISVCQVSRLPEKETELPYSVDSAPNGEIVGMSWASECLK